MALRFGFIGSGNMSGAFARGLAEPALFTDGGSGRAAELAAELGGEASSSDQIARRCGAVVLGHKPAQLDDVAAGLAGFDGVVISLLAATTLDQLRAAYPHAAVVRTMPNIPVELGSGVLAVAQESDEVPEVEPYLTRLGLIVRVPENQLALLTAIGGCAPAFFADFAAALVDAAERRGLDREVATTVVDQTMLGSARVLQAGEAHAQLSGRVASPGGLTEKARASLAQSGLAETVDGAVATVLGE